MNNTFNTSSVTLPSTILSSKAVSIARRMLVMMVLGTLMMLASFSASAQQSYPSADAAAEAFTDAISRNDSDKLNHVLGKDWKRFIPEQDIDRQDVYDFLAAWSKSHSIVSQAPGRSIVEVGGQGWTLPIPIVKHGIGWQFDLQAGADEMRTRRIGRNELDTMQATLAYYDAQKDYASIDRSDDGVLQYAQKFRSSEGKHDGLYWPSADNEPESPLGSLFAELKPGEGYHGYHYRILNAQGDDAPGGAYSYVIKGRMISGFALIAWPIRYGDSGVKSFMVSHDGVVYEKDLGTNSAAIGKKMTLFNPDPSWKKVALPEPQSANTGTNYNATVSP